MNYLSEKDDLGKFDKIIKQLLVLFCILKICPAYVSKHNTNCEKQIHFLLIRNKEE